MNWSIVLLKCGYGKRNAEPASPPWKHNRQNQSSEAFLNALGVSLRLLTQKHYRTITASL